MSDYDTYLAELGLPPIYNLAEEVVAEQVAEKVLSEVGTCNRIRFISVELNHYI